MPRDAGHRRPARRSPTGEPASRRSLLAFGCLGLVLGLLLTGCGLGALLAATATADPPPAAVADPETPDIVIAVHEAYFAEVMSQALPERWAGNVTMDVSPGNRVSVSGRVRSSLFGQTIEGDVTAVVVLTAQDGRLALAVEDLQAFGFSLAGIGQALGEQMMGEIGDLVDAKIKEGLGQGARLLDITTTDRHLILSAGLP